MEASALVYVTLTVVTVAFGIFVENREYVRLRVSRSLLPCMDRQRARNLTAELVIYGLLAGVSACRIAVGNDYWVYRFNFRLIAQERHVSSEFGFNYAVKWMQDLFGYDNYLPIFALFSLVTVFFFVKALHDQGEWYAVSLYLLLTGGYYFSSLNSVRYYLVLAVAMYSVKYVLRGEYGKFVLWILGAASFHKSVLLVIPVYLLAKWISGIRLRRFHFLLGGALAASAVLFRDFYRELIFLFYPFYRDSAFDTGGLSVVNVAKCLGVLLLSAFCWRRSIRDNRTNRFYFFLNVFGLLVYTFGSFIPEVSRIGYYMIVTQIFLIPNLLSDMEKGKWKIIFTAGTAAAFGLYFVIFLYKAYDVSIRLLPYLNWIFN